MSLNPSEKAFFKKLAKEAVEQNAKPLLEQTIEEYREGGKQLFANNCGEPADVSFKDITLKARDGYEVPVRFFNHDLPNTTPVIFYFPAGGYLLDLFKANATTASRIAKHSGMRVMFVNVRLAPENPMPTGLLDAFDVVKVVSQRAKEFHINPNNIIVAGHSAGGHAAVAISHLARHDQAVNIQQVITLCAWLDLTRSTKGFEAQEKEDAMANLDSLKYLEIHHKFNEINLKDPLISPFFESDLSNLPLTTLIVGEHDGIRADSEGYYQKLKNAGSRVEKIVIPGQTHCTAVLRPHLHEGPDPAEVIAQTAIKNL